jgi:hypothetical protein
MDGTCRIVALGGLGEVGKNLTVYEADGSSCRTSPTCATGPVRSAP